MSQKRTVKNTQLSRKYSDQSKVKGSNLEGTPRFTESYHIW